MTKPSELDYFLTWIAFFIVCTVTTLIVALIAGFCVGLALGIMDVETSMIELIAGIVGFLVSIPVSYICFRLCTRYILVSNLQRKMQIQIDDELARPTMQPYSPISGEYPAPPAYQVPPSP